MKKFYSAILLILLVTSVFAQKQKVKYLTTFDEKWVHFGFTLGVNVLDFSILNYNPIGENPDFLPCPPPPDGIDYESIVRSDVAELVPGFSVGIISSLRLTKDLNLRFLPGMSFGERKITYSVMKDINQHEIFHYSVKSTFLDFPLLIKYKARRINNDRPYIIFGPAYRLDISKSAEEDLVKLKKGGFYAEVGAGWDHYFPFFRFSVEAKFSFGLTNQLGDISASLQQQYYAQSIKHLRSNIFTLSFNFE